MFSSPGDELNSPKLRIIFMQFIQQVRSRGRSRTAAISKMGHFVVIVNGWKLENMLGKKET